jgi:tetratricopeptide (TPR) repeat protein
VHRFFFPLALLLLVFLTSGCGATAKHRKEAETHYMLGVSYLRERNPTLALRELQLAEQKDAGNADIQNSLAQAYQQKHALPDAERHYLRAIRLDRDNPTYQNNLAALYLDMARWDDAIRHFRKAADNLLFTSPEVALTGIGYAYSQKGEYLDAVGACKEALNSNPRYTQAHLQLGEAYYGLDKTGPAIEAYRQALTLSPNYALAHYRLGQAYMKLKQHDQAVASFREVRRLAPDSELGRSVAEYINILK